LYTTFVDAFIFSLAVVMVLETIYVVRHAVHFSLPQSFQLALHPTNTSQFRMAYSLDPTVLRYYSNIPTPTGLPADVALSSYGERQAEQLGLHLAELDPPIDQVISSPYYRCLQTLKPGVLRLQSERAYEGGVRLESGFEEWYGATGDHRQQPRPLEYKPLKRDFFPELDLRWDLPREGDGDGRGGDGVIRPNKFGESVDALHDRVAYALHRTIERADREGHKAIIICMHAAVMIAIGRALTGRMPDDYTEDDFQCYTASMSKYSRRQPYKTVEEFGEVEKWDERQQHKVPDVRWRGKGVMGGWDSILNANCSYLAGGEERGWKFSGDESFLADPNGFNDQAIEKASEQGGTEGGEGLNLNRALCIAVAAAEDDEKEEEAERSNRSKL
jgi:transcription factor C subunit 7